MNELSGSSQVYIGNIEDPNLARLVAELPTTCGCFAFSPRWDGHRINPPCEIVELGMRLLELGRETGEQLREEREARERQE